MTTWRSALFVGLLAGVWTSAAAAPPQGGAGQLDQTRTSAEALVGGLKGRNDAAAAAAIAGDLATKGTAARTLLDDFVALGTGSGSAKDALTKAGKAALTAASAVHDKAAAAVGAARTAARGVLGEPAKGRALAAADAGSVASDSLRAVIDAASKQQTALEAATSSAAVGTAATAAATELEKAMVAISSLAAAVLEAASQAAAPDLPVTTSADEDIFEALRLNITAGAIFFNGDHQIVKTTTNDTTTATVQSSQFSQAAAYFALEAQPRLWAWGSPRCGVAKPAAAADWAGWKAQCSVIKNRKLVERGFSDYYLEPIINVRFTTIGVNTGGTVVAPEATVLKSDKATQVQAGVLVGMNFGGFTVNQSRFHWSAGPILRGAFQAVTDGSRSARVWNLEDDLYGAYSGGVRVSLYQKDRRAGDGVRSGWSPVAYVEVTRGTFQNFERATAKAGKADAASCLADTAACLARATLPPESDYDLKSDRRLAFEARLMLQFLYLGVDINNGDGPDDIRFIGGLTVKLDRFFARR